MRRPGPTGRKQRRARVDAVDDTTLLMMDENVSRYCPVFWGKALKRFARPAGVRPTNLRTSKKNPVVIISTVLLCLVIFFFFFFFVLLLFAIVVSVAMVLIKSLHPTP